MKKIFLSIHIFIFIHKLVAQDLHYSQYYASPLYLNPAFAGSSLSPRLTANYRVQWPNGGLTPNGATIGFDNYFENINSGFGLLFNTVNYSSIFKSNEIGLLYAYNLAITENLFFKLGLQGSFTNKGFNFDNLIFPDQILSNQSSQETSKFPPIKYADFSSGLLLYGERYWFGTSMNHLNKPNQSYFRSNLNNSLPIKFNFHGGYLFVFDEYLRKGEMPSKSLSPSFNYYQQGNFKQFCLSTYFTYSPLSFGVLYRGIPIRKNASGSLANESLGINIGYRQENISLGYSFDFNISAIRPSGGAHEIALIYRFEPLEIKRRRRTQIIPIPIFEF